MVKYFTDRLILTPGPTEIPWRVLRALIQKTTNPDLDPKFVEYYNGVRVKIAKMLNASRGTTYVLSGEAMLGLEAAIANTIKDGDKVLVISNGVFGEAFADLVKAYGGKPVILPKDYREAVTALDVEHALKANGDVKAVTLVHCETPSGLLNPLKEVAAVVRDSDAVLIVDAVSSIGTTPIDFDSWGIDILIGGSQKALNLPPGLTIVTISRKAWDLIEERRYSGFYLNLLLWRDEFDGKGVFPYTPPETLIYALNEAIDMLFEEGIENVYKRHELALRASWNAVQALNLEPYPRSIEYASPSVTAVVVPSNINEGELREVMLSKYGIFIAGSWGKLAGKVIRIGHMGYTASRTHLIAAFTSLAKALRDLGMDVSEGRVVEAIDDVYK